MSLILTGNSSTLTVDSTNGITFPNSTTQASAGNVLQVVSVSSTTQVSGTTTSYTDTGISATITPKFSTSKILVVTTINTFYAGSTNQAGGGLRLLRGSTVISYPVENSSNAPYGSAAGYTSNGFFGARETISYLDSPATINATTYKTQIASILSSVTFWVNKADGTTPNSTITLMEIAA